MALKLITPPATPPAYLSEVKAYLRIDGTDFDTVLNDLLSSACRYCREFQNRSYVTETWELILDEFPCLPLSLPRPPLQIVDSITFVDQSGTEIIWDPSNYLVDNASERGRIAFAYGKSWPSITLSPLNGIRIRFTSGYGDISAVPPLFQTAVKLFIAHRFENPDSQDVPEAVHLLLWPDRIVPV